MKRQLYKYSPFPTNVISLPDYDIFCDNETIHDLYRFNLYATSCFLFMTVFLIIPNAGLVYSSVIFYILMIVILYLSVLNQEKPRETVRLIFSIILYEYSLSMILMRLTAEIHSDTIYLFTFLFLYIYCWDSTRCAIFSENEDNVDTKKFVAINIYFSNKIHNFFTKTFKNLIKILSNLKHRIFSRNLNKLHIFSYLISRLKNRRKILKCLKQSISFYYQQLIKYKIKFDQQILSTFIQDQIKKSDNFNKYKNIQITQLSIDTIAEEIILIEKLVLLTICLIKYPENLSRKNLTTIFKSFKERITKKNTKYIFYENTEVILLDFFHYFLNTSTQIPYKNTYNLYFQFLLVNFSNEVNFVSMKNHFNNFNTEKCYIIISRKFKYSHLYQHTSKKNNSVDYNNAIKYDIQQKRLIFENNKTSTCRSCYIDNFLKRIWAIYNINYHKKHKSSRYYAKRNINKKNFCKGTDKNRNKKEKKYSFKANSSKGYQKDFNKKIHKKPLRLEDVYIWKRVRTIPTIGITASVFATILLSSRYRDKNQVSLLFSFNIFFFIVLSKNLEKYKVFYMKKACFAFSFFTSCVIFFTEFHLFLYYIIYLIFYLGVGILSVIILNKEALKNTKFKKTGQRDTK